MTNQDLEFEKLDSLIDGNISISVPDGFSERVMQEIELQSPCIVFWQRPWVQWAATSIGLAFALGRLFSYIFSTWLAIELAG